MCEPASIKYTSGSSFTCSDTTSAKACAKRTYEAAVELFAYLCKQYGLDPTADGVIISHKEGHSRGIASNHGDPEHLWNGLGMGYTMDTFRATVKAVMSNGSSTATPSTDTEQMYRVRKTWADAKSQIGAYRVLKNAKAACKEGYTVYDKDGNAVYTNAAAMSYKVKVTASVLNIRKGPGTNYDVSGQIKDKGVYTIVEESTGTRATLWGKLKSGAGWISLDYATKV